MFVSPGLAIEAVVPQVRPRVQAEAGRQQPSGMPVVGGLPFSRHRFRAWPTRPPARLTSNAPSAGPNKIS